MKKTTLENNITENVSNFNFLNWKLISMAIVGILLLTILFGSLYTIEAGHRGVLLTFGKPETVVITEGINFKIPLIQQIVKIDVRTQKYETDASAASKDLQIVHTKIAVNFHLLTESVVELYKEIGLNFGDKVIQPSVQEVVKAATARFTAEELITRREEVKQQILDHLKDRLKTRKLLVEDISITNFDFSSSFNAAIEAKVTAEQEALAAKNKLEQVKFEAEQRVAKAEAEATAIRIQAASINSQGGKDYVALKAIERWDGKLPVQMIPGTTVPFINLGEQK